MTTAKVLKSVRTALIAIRIVLVIGYMSQGNYFGAVGTACSFIDHLLTYLDSPKEAKKETSLFGNWHCREGSVKTRRKKQ